MDYPGNSSLSSDVRERVLNTYKQTLGLASQGNRQEASLGCDFILRLDPEFEPARTLMTRLEEGSGPVAVDDLQPGGPAFSAASDSDELLGGLEHVDLDLSGSEGAAGGEAGTGESGALKAEVRQLLQSHQLAEAIQKVEAAGDAAAADPEIQEMVRSARARQEAAPYLRSFLDSARSELKAGNREEAARFLESARELDPSHPELRELEGQIDPGAGAPPAPEGDLDALGSVDLSLDAGGESGGATGDDGRIQDLLQEGQTAFEQKDYQGAIDAWSRIFLIDIDHQEAARRIEKARREKAEHERQLEEIFHEGVAAFEAGEADKAQELLQQVLSLQPNHLAAKEYLQKIEAGELPSGAGESPTASAAAAPATGAPAASPAAPSVGSGGAAGGTAIPSLPELDDEAFDDDILIPPEPMDEADGGAMPATDTSSRSNRTLLFVGGLVVVLVIAGAWLVFQQWDTWFPNATEPPIATTLDAIRNAEGLHRLGQIEEAISRLQEISPGDPSYEEAQALISQWQAEANTPTGSQRGDGELAPDDPGARPVDPQVASVQAALVSEAQRALRNDRYFHAESLLLEAQQIGDLDAETEALKAEIGQTLDPLRTQITMVRDSNWEYALPDLWRMRESDPGNRDVNELLVLSYFNLGVRDLQRGDAENAVSRFEEAVGLLEGNDPELQRHLSFARAYQGRSKDLLYQIYVKYLPIRR